MKTRFMIGMIGGIILVAVAFSLLSFPALALALGGDVSKTQGVIMTIDFKKNTMVVNEKTFVWDKSSTFYNEKEQKIDIDRFSVKSWVFIVGEKGDKNIAIKKIYLLPKYVDRNERSQYPFMQ